MTNNPPISRTTEIGKTTYQFEQKPAIKKLMAEIAATYSAYGNCVETWLMCSQRAPADDMIVVSEIGEQWSPQTAPARHADMPM